MLGLGLWCCCALGLAALQVAGAGGSYRVVLFIAVRSGTFLASSRGLVVLPRRCEVRSIEVGAPGELAVRWVLQLYEWQVRAQLSGGASHPG